MFRRLIVISIIAITFCSGCFNPAVTKDATTRPTVTLKPTKYEPTPEPELAAGEMLFINGDKVYKGYTKDMPIGVLLYKKDDIEFKISLKNCNDDFLYTQDKGSIKNTYYIAIMPATLFQMIEFSDGVFRGNISGNFGYSYGSYDFSLLEAEKFDNGATADTVVIDPKWLGTWEKVNATENDNCLIDITLINQYMLVLEIKQTINGELTQSKGTLFFDGNRGNLFSLSKDYIADLRDDKLEIKYMQDSGITYKTDLIGTYIKKS